MQKMYRDMLLFTFMVVFLALAPLVVLYAMGYRLGNQAAVDPVPVGVLMVETEPRRAILSVADKEIGTTPRTVSNLVPGLVNVTITKEGYTDWVKAIPIVSGVVNEFRHVRLFPKALETSSLFSDLQSFTLAPNRRIVAIVDSKNILHILDEEGEDVIPEVVLGFTPTMLLWSPESSALLVQKSVTSHYIISLTDPEKPMLRPLKVSPVKDSVWDPRIPGRLLVLLQNGNLEALNVFNMVSERIATDINTFATGSRNIYHISETSEFTSRNLQGDIEKQFENLTALPIERLLATSDGKIAYLTADKSLHVVNLDGSSTQVAPNVIDAQWSPDGTLLLVQVESNALHVWNPGYVYIPWIPEKTLMLVQRRTSHIRYPQWFAGSRHIVYQTEDQLMITEVDTRDYPINTLIDSTNTGNAHAAVGRDGERLFYIKLIDSVPTLITGLLTLP